MRKHLLISIIVAPLLFPSCAGYKVRQVNVRPPEQYASTATDGFISVAADPLDSEPRSTAVFNTDLNRVGILAVNLVLRNDGNQRYLVDRSTIYLLDRQGIKVLPSTSEMIIQSAGTSIAKWWFISGVLGGLSADRARKKMRDDFINKELKNHEITPGMVTYGFLYFQHQVGAQGAKGYRLVITNSPSGAPLEVPIR